MGFEIKIDEHKNETFFNRIADKKPLMKELALMGLSAIQKNVESNINPKNASLTQKIKQGGQTLRDSGTLRKSLTAQHTAATAEVGTNVPYAKIHNPTDGRTKTVIKPKKAQYLCIPASAKTRTLFRTYGWSPREVISGLEAKGYSVFRPYKKSTSQRSNVILAKKKNEKAEAIFILKKQTTLPARPFMYLSDAVIEAMETRVENYFSNKN